MTENISMLAASRLRIRLPWSAVIIPLLLRNLVKILILSVDLVLFTGSVSLMGTVLLDTRYEIICSIAFLCLSFSWCPLV